MRPGDSRNDACDACAGAATRRDFIRRAGIALALIAGSRVPLGADMIGEVAATSRRGATLTYGIPDHDGAVIDRQHEVILVRWEGRAYAFALSCPHQRTMLRWEADDGRFQCPKHHSRYRPDGSFISGRATRGMDRFTIRIENGLIVVDTDHSFHNDEDMAGWSAAVVTLPAASAGGG